MIVPTIATSLLILLALLLAYRIIIVFYTTIHSWIRLALESVVIGMVALMIVVVSMSITHHEDFSVIQILTLIKVHMFDCIGLYIKPTIKSIVLSEYVRNATVSIITAIIE